MFKTGAQLVKGVLKIAKALRKWRKEQEWADDILETAGSCVAKHRFLPGTKVLLSPPSTPRRARSAGPGPTTRAEATTGRSRSAGTGC